MAQLVEHLPDQHKALSPNSGATKKKRKRKWPKYAVYRRHTLGSKKQTSKRTEKYMPHKPYNHITTKKLVWSY
jgi:hypothetical protein